MSARSDFVWGVVGPGEIAHQFCRSLAAAGAGRVGPVLSRSPERAAAFCAEHGGEPATSLDALIERMQREPTRQRAVYVATPHALHAEAVRPCLEAGVAVLCEKPLTCDLFTTQDLIELARTTGTPLAEAYMYRAHPQIARIPRLAEEHDLGRLVEIVSGFCFEAPYDPGHRLFSRELGGGAILDVGGYPLSLAMALSGSKSTPEIAHAHHSGNGWIHDLSAVAHWRLAEGVQLFEHVALDREESRHAEARYERGTITIEHPFLPGGRRDGRSTTLTVQCVGEEEVAVHEERIDAPHDCYGLEAHAFEAQVAHRRTSPSSPLVTHTESLALARALDRWRAEADQNWLERMGPR